MHHIENTFNMGMFYNLRCHSKLVLSQIPNTHIRAFSKWSTPPPPLLEYYYTLSNYIPNIFLSPPPVRYMKVPSGPMRRTGSWGYLAGSWRKATPHCIIIVMNIKENETILFKGCLIHFPPTSDQMPTKCGSSDWSN